MLRPYRARCAGTAPSPRRPGSRCDQPPDAAHAATSRRTRHPAISRRSTGRVRCRREGSSFPIALGEDGRYVDRVALQFLGKDQQAMIGYPLRIENAVEMVAFMLHDAGMKPGRLALDRIAVEVDTAITHLQMARHHAAQA